jgi:hypothetical protein
MVKIFFLNFNSKINKQLTLKTVSIINLFITHLFIIKMPNLSETERIEVLMMIGYGDRRLHIKSQGFPRNHSRDI